MSYYLKTYILTLRLSDLSNLLPEMIDLSFENETGLGNPRQSFRCSHTQSKRLESKLHVDIWPRWNRQHWHLVDF